MGFIILEERDCCVEIRWLAVDRAYHGRGVRTRLLRKAEEWACERGERILSVKTYGGGDYEPYRRTLSFYLSRGFRLYEVFRSYEGFHGQPAAILLKPLDCSV